MPDTALELQRKYLFPGIKTYYGEPLVLSDGRGCRVLDRDGTSYLDMFGGILTTSVGHAHPGVTEAITLQAQRLTHTSTCYLNQPMLDLAARLARITPGRLQKCFFTNSGTEANETAVMAARVFTGNHHVIALRSSYHGRSSLATTLTGNASWRPPVVDHPGIIHAHSGYCYRCAFRLEYPSCEVACARDLEQLIQTTTSGRVAALIAEPILGVGGFVVPPPEYFRLAVEIVRGYGGVFICDEVQTGFARTGKMFGIDHWSVEPDIMVFAKGLANGSPIGATVATPEIADACQTSSISTFGGNPVSSAAALATLDVIEQDGFCEHVTSMGERLRAGLVQLEAEFSFVGQVRGMGLMQAIELVDEAGQPAADMTTRLIDLAREEQMLVGRGGLYGNVIRLTPPMTISAGEIDEALQKLCGACRRLVGAG